MSIPSVLSGLSARPLAAKRSRQATRDVPTARRLLHSLRLGLGVLAVGGLMACGGPVEFDLIQNITEEKIVGNPAGGALTTFLPTPAVFAFDLPGATAAHNAKAPVASVGLTSLQFQASGAGSFDFVQTISVYVESTRANSSLGQELVGTLPGAPGKSVTINLTPISSVNLLPYIGEGARLTASATGTLPPQDVIFTGSFSVHVKTL